VPAARARTRLIERKTVAEVPLTGLSFGHAQLGSAAEHLQSLVEQNPPGIKARTAKLGMAQRAAVHAGSKTDSDEAFLAGRAAVEAAIRGRDR